MKRYDRSVSCTRLLFFILTGALITALIIFLTVQVTIISAQQHRSETQHGILGGRGETKSKVDELSDSLGKVAEQVNLIKQMLLALQGETEVVKDNIQKRHSLEETVEGFSEELYTLRDSLQLSNRKAAVVADSPGNLYMGNSVVMCWIEHFKQYFFLDSRDKAVTPHLCQGSIWERKITEAVEKAVLPGQFVVDVGASIGWYTAAFAQAVGPSGRVLAVEAHPRLTDLMGRSMQNAPHVRFVNKAVGSEDDKKVFIENDMSWSPGNKVSDRKDGNVEVEYLKLDTLLQDEAWHKVDVIKVDVEGHELRVWEGMQDTLHENPNVTVLLEVNAGRDKSNGLDPKKFYDDLSKRFKKLHRIDPDSGALLETSTSELLSLNENVVLFLKN